MMRWNHLPVAGGIYDQHPELMDRFHYIFVKRAEHEERERKKQEQQRKSKMGGASRSPSRGRRR